MNDDGTDYEPDFSEINAIVKRRYETGEYGSAHFRVGRWVLDEMREHVSTPGTYPQGWLGGYSIGDLMGIPVLVDESMGLGWWQLVDRRVVPDGDGFRMEESVITEGTVR